MRGAGLAVGDEQGDGHVNGLVVKGGPLERVVVLHHDDGGALDGVGLGVRHGKAVGHAGLAHVLAGQEGLVDGIGIVGDAQVGGTVGNKAQNGLAAVGVLVDEDVVFLDELAHCGLLVCAGGRTPPGSHNTLMITKTRGHGSHASEPKERGRAPRRATRPQSSRLATSGRS